MRIIRSEAGDFRLLEAEELYKAAPSEVYARVASMVSEGKLVQVAAVYVYEAGVEKLLGVLDENGQIQQPPSEVVQKGVPVGNAAEPATAGEVAGDTAAQRTARIKQYQQRVLERRQVELESQIENTPVPQVYALIDELGTIERRLRELRESDQRNLQKGEAMDDIDLLELGIVRRSTLNLPDSISKAAADEARNYVMGLSDPFGLRGAR